MCTSNRQKHRRGTAVALGTGLGRVLERKMKLKCIFDQFLRYIIIVIIILIILIIIISSFVNDTDD